MANVYLTCTIGLTAANWKAFTKLGELLSHYSQPFVIGGDWNTTPQELHKSGWPAAIGGKIIYPGQPGGTCAPAGRILDYYVVSESLASSC